MLRKNFKKYSYLKIFDTTLVWQPVSQIREELEILDSPSPPKNNLWRPPSLGLGPILLMQDALDLCVIYAYALLVTF